MISSSRSGAMLSLPLFLTTETSFRSLSVDSLFSLIGQNYVSMPMGNGTVLLLPLNRNNCSLGRRKGTMTVR